jgi:hypothetical protein
VSEQEEQAEPVRQPLAPAVISALAATEPKAEDGGAVALAVRYAELMDEAVAAQKYTKALRLIGAAVESRADDMLPTDAQQLMNAWDQISSALAEHSVASDLGPKLLAALTALGATVSGRAKEAGPGGEKSDLPSPLRLVRNDTAQAPWRTGAIASS